jgi:hypothetical protein
MIGIWKLTDRFLKRFIALININHTCKLQNCSLINQFTTVSLQLHVGEFDLAKITAVKTNTQYTKNIADGPLSLLPMWVELKHAFNN